MFYAFKNHEYQVNNPCEENIVKITIAYDKLMGMIAHENNNDFFELCVSSRNDKHLISRVIHTLFDGKYGFIDYNNNELILYNITR